MPGFDDAVIKTSIEAAGRSELRALVLQLYGTGNLPSIKEGLLQACVGVWGACATAVCDHW